MSSFDFGSKQELDPTADFLARERAAAGALQDDADLFGGSGSGGAGNSLSALQGQSSSGAPNTDFERSAANFPALDGEDDGFGGPQGGAQNTMTAFDDDDDDLLGGAGGHAAPAHAQDAEVAQFESNFPELEDTSAPAPPAAVPMTNGNGFTAENVSSNSYGIPTQERSFGGVGADPYGSAHDEEESEAVRRWREDQEEDIARREATAERKKAETVSKAEQDIDEFYNEYNKKKEKNIAKNKEAEAQFKAQRQAELAEGTTWSRVTKLVDLKNSQSKTIARTGPGASDLTRMKEILLSLRREGETAPGAAGY